MILESLLPALFPALADGVRGVFAKITGNRGAAPMNVDESIKLMSADIDRLKALAQLDAPAANVSAWVSNVRALQRPVAVLVVLLVYMLAVYRVNTGHALPESVLAGVFSYAQMVTFYLFGDRSYSHLKGGK
jgi:hypothetical protein